MSENPVNHPAHYQLDNGMEAIDVIRGVLGDKGYKAFAGGTRMEKLNKILHDHKEWLETYGKNGTRANLRGADISGADLRGANLRRADLCGANLRRADLSGANLSGADLSWADLSGANLGGADLSWAGLSAADLHGAYLYGAALSGANLNWADLHGAYLSRADLSRADLSGANFGGADLSRADLSAADLHGAYLYGAALSWADLSGADLRGAIMPEGIYTAGGAGNEQRRYTYYDAINDRIICGCWDDDGGNHLDSFKKRIENIYGPDGEKPNPAHYKAYRAAIKYFEACRDAYIVDA